MNILHKLLDKFKKKEEHKNQEPWYNESAQKGEIYVKDPLAGLDSGGVYEASLTESTVNRSC